MASPNPEALDLRPYCIPEPANLDAPRLRLACPQCGEPMGFCPAEDPHVGATTIIVRTHKAGMVYFGLGEKPNIKSDPEPGDRTLYAVQLIFRCLSGHYLGMDLFQHSDQPVLTFQLNPIDRDFQDVILTPEGEAILL